MNKYIYKSLTILLAVIMLLNIVGCVNEADNKEGEDVSSSETEAAVNETKEGETQTDVSPSETESAVNETEENTKAGESQTDVLSSEAETTVSETEEEQLIEGPLVFENFVSGVLVDESSDYKLWLEVTSIEMSPEGMKIHYNVDRKANSSYSNYYTLSKVVLDGCIVEGEYYTDDKRHDSMGRKAGEAEGDTYYLIPNIVLNAMGFDGSWTSLEITFWAGYSAYNTVTEQFRQEFILYSGAKSEIPTHKLSEDGRIGTIYENDEVKFIVMGVEMFTGNLGKWSGQNVYVYTQSSNVRWKATMSVTVDDKFVVANETVFVNAGETCVQIVEFRQSNTKKFNYQEADMSKAIWKIILVNMETNEKAEYKIPIDLSVK